MQNANAEDPPKIVWAFLIFQHFKQAKTQDLHQKYIDLCSTDVRSKSEFQAMHLLANLNSNKEIATDQLHV